MLAAVLAGAATAGAVTPLASTVLRRRAALDIPNHRSSHRIPVPRGGGVALMVGTAAALIVAHSHLRASLVLAVFLPAAAAGILGLTDDLTGGVSVKVRLSILVAVALAGAACEAALTDHPGVWVVALTVVLGVWVTGFTNFFNFMDGINGIACTEVVLSGVALGALADHLHRPTVEAASLALAAAAIGFLPFNFPRARVFLGDVGSYFAGAALGLLVGLAVLRGFTVEAAAAPVAVFVADATVTLGRRILGGRHWATAHREHTYQRLVDAGWSHTATTSVVAVVTAACAALGSVSLVAGGAGRALADSGMVLALAVYLSLPHLVGQRRTPSLGRVRIEGSSR